MEPQLHSWDLETLNRAKARPGEYRPALDALRADANRALDIAPQSVMDKKALPPSGDRHDYMSLGSYWWPNPDTADGLPYVLEHLIPRLAAAVDGDPATSTD